MIGALRVYRAVLAARKEANAALRYAQCVDRIYVRHAIGDLDRIAARLEPVATALEGWT